MDELLKLADRCERATGPDRQLDFDIAAAVGAVAPAQLLNSRLSTFSLDAAMTLVPEDWTRGLLTWPGYDNGKLIANAKAELHHAVSSGGGPLTVGLGQTLPLALCAAALRARAGKHGEEK